MSKQNTRIFYRGSIPNDYYGNQEKLTVENFADVVSEIETDADYAVLLDEHGIMTYIAGLKIKSGKARRLNGEEGLKLCEYWGFNFNEFSPRANVRVH